MVRKRTGGDVQGFGGGECPDTYTRLYTWTTDSTHLLKHKPTPANSLRRRPPSEPRLPVEFISTQNYNFERLPRPHSGPTVGCFNELSFAVNKPIEKNTQNNLSPYD